MNSFTWLLVRASPKSQILRSQLAFTSRFDGLRSRCRMLAEWMNLSPRRTCGTAAGAARRGCVSAAAGQHDAHEHSAPDGPRLVSRPELPLPELGARPGMPPA
eukprot:354398-Chlamydomonas_euryale.AAC.1